MSGAFFVALLFFHVAVELVFEQEHFPVRGATSADEYSFVFALLDVPQHRVEQEVSRVGSIWCTWALSAMELQ